MSDSYVWPEGYASAFALTVDVDAVTPMLWRLRSSGVYPPDETEFRSFGLRQGIDRLLEVLAALDFPATFFVPGFIAETYPHVVEAISRQGLEIGLHGYIHEDVDQLDENQNREILKRSIAILEDRTNTRPIGYRSPSWKVTGFLPRLLKEHGVRYDSSLMGYEHPYTFDGLTELPVSWTLDDATYFFYLGRENDIGPPWPPQPVEAAWRAEVAAAKRFSSLACLTIHPWLCGRGHRVLALERLLRDIRSDPKIWIANCRDIAAYHENSLNRDRFAVER